MSSITSAQAARQDHRDHEGRYSAYERSESETNLDMTKDDITQRGSFYFPPRFTTAEDTIDFYNRIDIDDEVMARVIIASNQHRRAIIEQLEERKQESIAIRVKEHMDEWDRQPENRRKKRSPERAEVEQAERDRLDELPYSDFGSDDPPAAFGTQDGSEIIRAIKMCQYRPSPARFPEESQLVEDHVVTLDDEDLTVRQIMDKYATDAVKEQLVYQPKQVEDQTGDLLEQIGALRQEVAALRQLSSDSLENDRVIARGIDDIEREMDSRFSVQESVAGLRDSRGNINTAGRRIMNKLTWRE